MTERSVRVHLVRHGQSTWNLERRLQGQTAHPPLTPLGRTQAERAAEELASLIGDATCRLFTSDLIRARQTADVIAGRLGVDVRETASLREQHLGDMQGRLGHELAPEPVPDNAHISEVRWAGGESITDVHVRLSEFFAHSLPLVEEHLIAVTHGDTLRVALAVLAGRSHREVSWDEVVPNATVISTEVFVATDPG